MTTPAADAPTDTETPDAPTETSSPETQPTETPDTGDDAARWKAMARKHESENRKLAKQLEELKTAAMSDREREIAEAAAKAAEDARSSTLASVGSQLAAAELRAAGVDKDYLEDLNLAKYVNDDGTVNLEAVAATAAKFAKKPTAPVVPVGPQNGSKPPQLTRSDLQRMSPEEITKAREDGRLDDLLAGD